MVVWNFNWWIAVFPISLLISSWGKLSRISCRGPTLTVFPGVNFWALNTDFDTGVVAEVKVTLLVGLQIRYFYILTFCLNFLCASELYCANATAIWKGLDMRHATQF